MAGDQANAQGLFALPNEILLQIFDFFPTKDLVPLTPVCRIFHTVILRLLHHRLQVAAGLNGRMLYLECHHPSEKLTAQKLFCLPLGTDGLDEMLDEERDPGICMGRIEQCGSLFTRFRPQRSESLYRFRWRVPGDIQGSRTYAASGGDNGGDDEGAKERKQVGVDEKAGLESATVTIDANELFSQLSASTWLSRHEHLGGHISRMNISIEDVSEGTIRVWRKWLADQCESRTWTDGEPVVIHHNNNSNNIKQQQTAATGEAGSSNAVTTPVHPLKDPSILWINTKKQDVGIKFRVKNKRWKHANPVLFASDEEITVSYQVEFEEVVVRTSHLLLKLEHAQEQMANPLGKAVIFSSFRG